MEQKPAEVSPPHTIWQYGSANWNGLQSAFPSNEVYFLAIDPLKIYCQINEVIKFGTDAYFPHLTQIAASKTVENKKCLNLSEKKPIKNLLQFALIFFKHHVTWVFSWMARKMLECSL